MPTKENIYVIRGKSKTKELLRKITKNSGKTQDQVMWLLFNLHDTLDLLADGWKERLAAAERVGAWQLQREKHFAKSDRCLGFREADGKWKCIAGREEKTPMIRILAEDYDDALNLCEGCQLTLEPIRKNREYRKQIDDLEDRLQRKVSVKYKVPICHKGAILNEDSTEFSSCPKHKGENVSIANFCKIYSSGLPCMLYAERVIGLADGESELSKEKNT